MPHCLGQRGQAKDRHTVSITTDTIYTRKSTVTASPHTKKNIIIRHNAGAIIAENPLAQDANTGTRDNDSHHTKQSSWKTLNLYKVWKASWPLTSMCSKNYTLRRQRHHLIPQGHWHYNTKSKQNLRAAQFWIQTYPNPIILSISFVLPIQKPHILMLSHEFKKGQI